MAGCSSQGLMALKEPFDRLAQCLGEALDGRRMVFLQNPGNAGDALIRFGTLCFFEDLGLDFLDLDMGRRSHKALSMAWAAWGGLRRDRVMVYGGSGCWGEAWNGGQTQARRLSRLTGELIVLPTTFQIFDLTRFIAAFRRD